MLHLSLVEAEKIHGYTEMLADKLGLPQERVALRGEEVLQEVTFEQPDIEKIRSS